VLRRRRTDDGRFTIKNLLSVLRVCSTKTHQGKLRKIGNRHVDDDVDVDDVISHKRKFLKSGRACKLHRDRRGQGMFGFWRRLAGARGLETLHDFWRGARNRR